MSYKDDCYYLQEYRKLSGDSSFVCSEQKVSPMKNGRTGMITLDTIASTIFWNSSSKDETRLAFVQVAARPSIMDNTSALITGIICGMESSKITSGRVLRLSAVELIDKCGISAYPDTAENKAAPSEEA